MNLVIVESSTKAKIIANYLNNATELSHLGSFDVVACLGHIRDLPKKTLGIDVTNNFQPQFSYIASKHKTIQTLLKKSQTAKHIYLASDPDIEGEAIAESCRICLKLKDHQYSRVTFTEINTPALVTAFLAPRKINQNLIEAQLTRRIIDRLVGFTLSPILWKQFDYQTYGALSAGRVQSATLQILIQHENNIKKFQSNSSYGISGRFHVIDEPVDMTCYHEDQSFVVRDQSTALQFLTQYQEQTKHTFTLIDVSTKTWEEPPPPPYITSTLQQDCFKQFRFSSDKTMKLAQSLYEHGFITYIRTDSYHMSEAFVKQCHTLLKNTYGASYVGTASFKKTNKHAQEAHECIRVTMFNISSCKKPKDWSHDHDALFDLLYKRTLASTMSSALYDICSLTVGEINKTHKWKCNISKCKFTGWKHIYGKIPDEDDFKKFQNNGAIDVMCESIRCKEAYSQPPARFHEGSLIHLLEREGIGRPSTYASILQKCKEKQYIVQTSIKGESKLCNDISLHMASSFITKKTYNQIVGGDTACLIPSELGCQINAFLEDSFLMILDTSFTSKVEQSLDEIEHGTTTRLAILSSFYSSFDAACKQKLATIQKSKTKKKQNGHDETEKSKEQVEGGDEEQEQEKEKEEKMPTIRNTNVSYKVTKHGYKLQKGTRVAYVPLSTNIQQITDDHLTMLFLFPRVLGTYEDKEVIIQKGKYGYYIEYGKYTISCKEGKYNMTDRDACKYLLNDAVKKIEEYREEREKKVVKEWSKIGIYNGPYGMYLRKGKQIKGIPKNMTEELCKKMTEKECQILYKSL